MSQKPKQMLIIRYGLGKLAEEDPTFTVRTDEASGQTIISGMGELTLRYYCRSFKA